MGWGWGGREGVVYFSFDIDLGSKTGRKRVLNRIRWDIPPLKVKIWRKVVDLVSEGGAFTVIAKNEKWEILAESC